MQANLDRRLAVNYLFMHSGREIWPGDSAYYQLRYDRKICFTCNKQRSLLCPTVNVILHHTQHVTDKSEGLRKVCIRCRRVRLSFLSWGFHLGKTERKVLLYRRRSSNQRKVVPSYKNMFISYKFRWIFSMKCSVRFIDSIRRGLHWIVI